MYHPTQPCLIGSVHLSFFHFHDFRLFLLRSNSSYFGTTSTRKMLENQLHLFHKYLLDQLQFKSRLALELFLISFTAPTSPPTGKSSYALATNFFHPFNLMKTSAPIVWAIFLVQDYYFLNHSNSTFFDWPLRFSESLIYLHSFLRNSNVCNKDSFESSKTDRQCREGEFIVITNTNPYQYHL